MFFSQFNAGFIQMSRYWFPASQFAVWFKFRHQSQWWFNHHASCTGFKPTDIQISYYVINRVKCTRHWGFPAHSCARAPGIRSTQHGLTVHWLCSTPLSRFHCWQSPQSYCSPFSLIVCSSVLISFISTALDEKLTALHRRTAGSTHPREKLERTHSAQQQIQSLWPQSLSDNHLLLLESHMPSSVQLRMLIQRISPVGSRYLHLLLRGLPNPVKLGSFLTQMQIQFLWDKQSAQNSYQCEHDSKLLCFDCFIVYLLY